MDDEKLVFNTVQQLLESLKDSDATFMFVSNGNFFTIKGNTTELISQILFAMCRYPVVEGVIKECAKRFDEVNRRAGHIARATIMDHLIDETVECKEVKR